MCVVYLHKRKDNNEVFYVGIGKTERRAYRVDERNKYWRHIYKKCGHIVEILFTELTWEEACKIEIELITKYGRKDLGTGNLCNMTAGGEGGYGRVLTEEHKKKISESHKGKDMNPEHMKKLWNSTRGKQLTDEHKAKISKPVLQFSKNGSFIKEFPSLVEATRQTGCIHIGKVCKNKRKTAGGFIWKYKE